MKSPFRGSSSGSERRDSTECFIPHDDDSGENSFTTKTYRRPDRAPVYLWLSVFFVLIGGFLFGGTWYLLTKRECRYGINGPNFIPTPMEEAISWAIRDLKDKSTYNEHGKKVPDSEHSMFLPPGPEADAAWADIMKYNNIRISPDEVPEDYRGLPGLVELNDGSGDIYANVAAYHSVHCIKRVHHMLYYEHYHPGRSEEQKVDLLQHAEHCLQYLLDAVRCNADLTIFPMQWGVGQRVPFGIDQGRHQCKDWNRIDDWMRSRSVDIYEPGLLMHPKFGWPYEGGAENITGVALDTLVSANEHDH